MAEGAVTAITPVGLLSLPETTAPEVIRAHIERLEALMLTLPQEEIPVTHTVNGDSYVRSIVIKAGLMATGATHRQATTHLVMQGRMTIITEANGMREVVAPCIFVSPPMSKMAGYAHEDTIWATAHSTKLRDIAAIEAELCYSNAELKLLRSDNPDHRDFAALLGQMGVSLEQVDHQVRDLSDHQPMPDGDWNIQFGPSAIAGEGAFTVRAAQPGDVLAPARRNGGRTTAGRFVNHSATPNAVMVALGDNLDLVADAPIEAGAEITLNYRQVLRARGLAPQLQGG